MVKHADLFKECRAKLLTLINNIANNEGLNGQVGYSILRWFQFYRTLELIFIE